MTPEEREARLEEIRKLRHVGPEAPALWLAMQVPFLFEELDRVTAERDEAKREADALEDVNMNIAAQRDAALAELERWRHGLPVEGDYVCPDSVALSAALAQVEKLREALLHCKHRPHEHNPGPEFTVAQCEVIDRALAVTETKR